MGNLQKLVKNTKQHLVVLAVLLIWRAIVSVNGGERGQGQIKSVITFMIIWLESFRSLHISQPRYHG